MELPTHHVIVYVTDAASERAMREITALLDVACPNGYTIRRGPYNRIDEDHTCIGDVLAQIQRIIEENP